jgi:mRNA-binding protein PUF3
MNLKMPVPTNSTSDDRSQSQAMNSVLPSSSLYQPNNIWSVNAINRPLGTQGADDAAPGIGVNSQSNGWNPRPWNSENQTRAESTSPNRARNGLAAHNPAFLDRSSGAIGGAQNGTAVGSRSFHDQMSSFPSQRLNQQNSGLLEASAAAFPSGSASRQSQGSPAFDNYRRGHTQNNSFHAHSHSHSLSNPGSLSAQSTNSIAFRFNRQQASQQSQPLMAEDDISLNVHRMHLDGNNAASPFNPASQSWRPEAGTSRYGHGSDPSAELLAAQLSASRRRPSVDRSSPAPSYHLDANNGSRPFAANPDAWSNMQSATGRDPRTSEVDRRALPPQISDQYSAMYANQYAYGNVPQYQPNYAPALQQNLRQPPYPSQGMPMQHSYVGGVNIANFNLAGMNLAAIPPMSDQDIARRNRSKLLEEYRGSHKSNRRFELRDISNHVVEFSGDQHGSRFIQTKLETANSDDKDQVFREIEANSVQLMKDVFGNYVVQKFFDYGNQSQKRILAEKMRGRVLDLSIQVYACRVVQKALEHVLVEQQVELVQELASDPLKVIKDANGNHVVQKIIEFVPREHFDFIMDAIRGQVAGLAVHAYGCRVIQRMLEKGTEQDKADIMKELNACAHILITDQFGNYVTQHVIERGSPGDSAHFIEMVLSQSLTYSKHKFASNVVEKCLTNCTPEQRTNVRKVLSGSNPETQLLGLARDQYANYVIQKLIDELSGEEQVAFKDEIRQILINYQKTTPLPRQLHTLSRKVDLDVGASPARPQTSGRVANSGSSNNTNMSTAPTPVLTNETNTPQSNSPPSVHAHADGPTSEGVKVSGMDEVKAEHPRVQETE